MQYIGGDCVNYVYFLRTFGKFLADLVWFDLLVGFDLLVNLIDSVTLLLINLQLSALPATHFSASIPFDAWFAINMSSIGLCAFSTFSMCSEVFAASCSFPNFDDIFILDRRPNSVKALFFKLVYPERYKATTILFS